MDVLLTVELEVRRQENRRHILGIRTFETKHHDLQWMLGLGHKSEVVRGILRPEVAEVPILTTV